MKTKIDDLRHRLDIKEGVAMGIHPDAVQNLLDIIEKQHERLDSNRSMLHIIYDNLIGSDQDLAKNIAIEVRQATHLSIEETTEMLEGVEL